MGTPQQLVRVLPSTTAPETWVVLDQGCLSSDPTSCPTDRGDIFQSNKSSTWEEKGIYQLGQELNLGYDVNNNGDYGFDTLGLGYQGAGGPTVENQTIAGIATKEFYLGILGLVPRPVNFSTESSTPSFLSNLKTQNLIPSLSYGYSAGAQYRKSSIDGHESFG